MHEDLKRVIELREVDQKIAELSSLIDSLPGQIQTLEAQLTEFLHAHEDRNQKLAASQKQRKEFEVDIQAIREKISKHKDQLYEVKTNEQYRAMLKEIEGEEEKIRKIEDRLLEKMIEAEEIQKQIAEAAARLDGEKSRVAAETKRLAALREEDTKERDELARRRKELSAALGESVRETYERIRKARNGVAVAEVRDGFCTGCNVRLRPQAYNEVRTNEIVLTCETCGRILYSLEDAPDARGQEAAEKADGASAQSLR